MRSRNTAAAVMFVLVWVGVRPVRAQLALGAVQGVVHDAQHRPVEGAQVNLRALTAQTGRSLATDANGEFHFAAVTLGDYLLTAEKPGFVPALLTVTVESGSTPDLHLLLKVASSAQSVTVTAPAVALPTASATPTTLVDRRQIERTPGAEEANSLAMITDYVPGAYMTHDMLHVRGGHQTMWLLDGVPMINTAIASTLGPALDPQDLGYLETQRGGYSAGFGDRTYGVFDAVPRSGFDSNREAELTATAGSFGQTDDHLSFASHTDRFAYYLSLAGNRSDLGLQPPTAAVVHDAENGAGVFGSFIDNLDPRNQIRAVTFLRRDYYQIPYDPNPNDLENGSNAANNFTPQWPSLGLRDAQKEWDGGLDFSWVHTFAAQTVLTISPFYHRNCSDYLSSPQDTPVATSEDLVSNYAGVQGSLAGQWAGNDFQLGGLGWHESDQQFFGAAFNDGSGRVPVTDREQPGASVETFFAEDKFQPWSWLSLSAGMRPTRYAESGVTPASETAVSPRFGAAIKLPRLGWTVRAFYGHYYQEPPLESVSGPALTSFAQAQGLAFVPLRGERDTEFEYGLAIPFRGWTLDSNSFRTHARDYLDHNNIGDSSLFFPITISDALIRGWELTLQSPRLAQRGQLHLAFSNQVAEGSGEITGGLSDFSSFPGLTHLDHDQRNTLNLGGSWSLPRNSYVGANLYYGSGFTNGLPGSPYPGAYLPANTRLDLSLGHTFNERWSLALESTNVLNQRVELDNSLTFGGFHWSNPRSVYLRLDYKFHY